MYPVLNLPEFTIHGVTQYFRGTVLLVSADNPASALLGGFKQSSAAFRFCRHCLSSASDIQTKVCALQCTSVCDILSFYA